MCSILEQCSMTEHLRCSILDWFVAVRIEKGASPPEKLDFRLWNEACFNSGERKRLSQVRRWRQAACKTYKRKSKNSGWHHMALAEQTFGFFIPTVSLMGVGSAKETGAQAKALGATNILIVTDAGLAKLGVADQIKKQLEEAGLKAVIFDGAEPNPTDKNVTQALRLQEEQVRQNHFPRRRQLA